MHTVEKFFNTAGPAQEDIHYTLNPLRRIRYDEISQLIDQRKYFVLHAPRQTGKTTSLLAMVKQINGEGRYHCAYVNVEAAQTARGDVLRGMRAILSRLESAVKQLLGMSIPDVDSLRMKNDGDTMLIEALESLCGVLDKPLVLFIDELDALIGDTLISVLRQLRDGYAKRPVFAPIAVILCGVRDVRDYRIHTAGGEIITGGSCFNVKAKSLRLGDFVQEDIRELYEQHTQATGQIFEEAVYPEVWRLTHGQPWLVNALANEATREMPEGRDRSRPITSEMIEEAANRLILSRATHLDQLAARLTEERVRRVIEPMLMGGTWELDPDSDNVQYAIDLGLIRRDSSRSLVISNDIYREIIPRELTTILQDKMAGTRGQPWYVRADGSLDMGKLLREFQQFFRENSESWLERFDYKEAGFQLLLQAFLQRIVNGGGQIEREYALGRGRVDLLVRWRYPKDTGRGGQKEQRIVLELKAIRDKNASLPEKIVAEGLEQTAGYADRSDATEAHLIVCDERLGRGWDEKIFERAERTGNREIFIHGV